MLPLVEGVELVVGAWPGRYPPSDDEQIGMNVNLLISPGHDLVWTATALEVTSMSWSGSKAVTITALQDPSGNAVGPGQNLKGSGDSARRPG